MAKKTQKLVRVWCFNEIGVNDLNVLLNEGYVVTATFTNSRSTDYLIEK